jgi:N-acetylglucosaminyldiphosphoundecaprenol N-acetyl-beta-D-mannosaminyltransferase
MARVELLGCPIDAVTMAEAVERVGQAVTSRETCQHVAINAAKLVKFQRDPALREAVLGCELVTADGQAVVWAARLLQQRLPERVAGIDLMNELLIEATLRGHRVFLLGARADVLARAEAAILERLPELQIVGRHHGYFAPDEEEAVVEQIALARPDLLFVALETPAKELFLARNRLRLSIPFIMGVGGTFDVLAGVRRRAPVPFRKLGLEWLYRLAQDPRRLAGRYVVGNSQFIWLVACAVARRQQSRIG